ncbi:MAG: hypothetical protein RL368_1398 [Pseudomonadota bacterium]|jgi:hypothetical protein
MKLPINLDSLLHPRPLFVLIALSSSIAIYGVLNDDQRAREAAYLQKETPSVTPAPIIESSPKAVTWAEAGKQLLILEEKRESLMKNSDSSKSITSLGQPIIIADPPKLPPSLKVPSKKITKNKNSKKKTCACAIKKIKRKKPCALQLNLANCFNLNPN